MENNKQNHLDDAIQAMKATEASAEDVKRSTERVFEQLREEQPARVPDRMTGCEDFRFAFAAYSRKELPEAKQLLVEDHLKTCARCRRAYAEFEGKVVAFAPPVRRQSPMRPFVPWAVAAGLLVGVGYLSMDSVDRMMAPAGPRAQVSNLSGEIYKVSAAGMTPLKAGDSIGEKEAVRTAKGANAIVRLPDGSLIEMNERSELSITGAFSGNTIKLDRGNIVVQAAKQKRGSLKVATRESTVSVKGTIFSVATGLRGTQVAVVEGNVLVEQGGKTEDLLPGQATGSDATLKRTTVSQQVAWSKDPARYIALLGEMDELKKKLATLPMPSPRTEARMLNRLPANTVVYAAIPNLSGQVADATKIFEDRMKQSEVLKEWWSSEQVAQMRLAAENLRSAGNQLGDEILFAAASDGKGIGEPFVVAELRNAGAKAQLEGQLKGILGVKSAELPLVLTEKYLIVAPKQETAAALRASIEAGNNGFENTKLGQTVKQSYAKGAGWVLAVDLEQILTRSVNGKDNAAMTMTGFNSMQNVLVERRDWAGRSDTRATVSFKEARRGMASWLSAPAPMSSLEYVSPEATFAMGAVTKSARQMAEEFFGIVQSTGGGNLAAQGQKELGVNVIDDLAGTIGGEITFAVDGALLPVPSWIAAIEVYNTSGLSSVLRQIVDQANAREPKLKVQFTEEQVAGRTWYKLASALMPVEFNLTFSDGYLLIASSRPTIEKAIQNRQTGRSLSRSQQFRSLLPVDSDVNTSAVLYFNTGSGLKDLANQAKDGLNLTDAQKASIAKLVNSSEPVLICAYAGDRNLTVASTTGFFGFGLDSLLMAGKGMPVLPAILGSAMRASNPLAQTGK